MKKISFDNSDLDALFNYGFLEKYLNYESEKYETIRLLKDDVITFEEKEFEERMGNDFIIEIRNNNSSIMVRNCNFRRKLIISGKGGPLLIDNVTFEDGLIIKYYCEELQVLHCKQQFDFELNARINADTTIDDCLFRELKLMPITSRSGVIKNVTVSGKTYIGKLFRAKNTYVSFNTTEIEMSGATSDSEKITITDNCHIEKFFFSEACNCQLDIVDSNIGDFIFKQGFAGRSLNISHSKIKKELIFDLPSKTSIQIVNYSSFDTALIISGCLESDSNLKITNSQFNKLVLKQVKNLGEIYLSNLKTETLAIIGSDLGKAEIHDCDFGGSRVEFEKSKVSEIFISETSFPKRIFSDGRQDYGQAKLFFGQLQTVFQKQGDSTRSYEYLAREVRAYYHDLHFLSKDFFTKLNLFFNLISNDFGRNWILGFGFSFGVGLVFFYALIISTDQYHIGFPLTPQGLTGPFLKFMNPLRHFEAEALFSTLKLPITLSGWSYVWDFLGRLFVAYGYYQTIQAFRKFGKK